MKQNICYFLFLLCSSAICAQPDSTNIAEEAQPSMQNIITNLQSDEEQSEDKESIYLFKHEEVVSSTLPQATLWINLKKWISSTFDNYKYVVDLEDKETGMMIVKWTAGPLHSLASRYLAITYGGSFQIDVREKKYRIKVYNAFAKAETDNVDDLDVLPGIIRIIRKNELKIKKLA